MAADLNPNDAETLIAAACGLAFLGHVDNARALAERAMQLNPIYPEYYSVYLSNISFMGGDHRTTIDAIEKCHEGFPDRGVWAAAALAHLGRKQEAVAAYKDFRRLAATHWEGSQPADDDSIEAWVMDMLPINWPEGRKSLLDGLRLARQMAEQAQA
ncbi:MAG: hypothetical protein NTW20_08450 [Rhodobacterales bacterium]|nr:hypothetical protein [Rhodobacterales bacterium]